MNEKIIINARIVDPSQKLDEMGSIIIDKNGKVKAIGKKVTKKDSPNAEVIDVKKNLIIPGIAIFPFKSIFSTDFETSEIFVFFPIDFIFPFSSITILPISSIF